MRVVVAINYLSGKEKVVLKSLSTAVIITGMEIMC
jgi:hypothetical protein